MDIFVDVDDTLVYHSESGRFHAEGDDEHPGPYELAHGGREFLRALANTPGIRLNFFSGGTARRNLKLIEDIMKDSFSPGDLVSLEYNIFSKEQTVEVDGLPKKMLRGLKQDLDLEYAIVVDDTADYYAAEGEERNFLAVYACEWKCLKHDHYAGKVFTARLNNKLVRALGMIFWSLEASRENKVSLVEALHALQWTGGSYRHDETNVKEIYDIGLKAMRRFNRDLELRVDQELGIYPWSGVALKQLGYEPDIHFTNIFSEEQLESVMKSLRTINLVEVDIKEAEPEDVILVEIVSQGRSDYKRLPGNTPASVVIASLDRDIYLLESGVLTKDGEEVPPSSTSLLPAGNYKYVVQLTPF